MSSQESPKISSVEIRTRLRDLWQAHEQKRSMGGRWAMAGFALQAHAFLLRFFQGIAGNAMEPLQLAELEGISDILVPENDRLTLIQAKRSLDKRALISALEEAYLLTELCLNQLPEALACIRFQITYRFRETPLLPTAITVEELFDGAASPDLFSLTLTLLHDQPLVEHADQSDRLYLFLWNEGLRNPKSIIEKGLGRLLDAFYDPTNHSLSAMARELCELFQDSPRIDSWKAPGQLLELSDVTPDSDSEYHGVLVGQRVTFEHIRKGYVKHRGSAFNPLVKKFDHWISEIRLRDKEIDEKIPVFWISGRSGDGKSVLLLQLIQSVIQRNPDFPIVHLRTGSGFLNLLDDPPASDRGPVFALVDDVYDLTDRASWDEAVREAVQLGMPPIVLITCGPTEQKDLFESNLGDVFRVESFTPDHVNVSEREEFVRWFEKRTNRTCLAEEMAEQNTLLVQIVFELAQGERLETFARKFRRRLETLDLFEIARTIIAVNALYEQAPFELLVSETQKVALRRLGAEDQLHFSIVEDRDEIHAGVRLAHAHLAWLLFAEWREPPYELGQQWASEIAKAVQTHLSAGWGVSAGKLLQSLATTPRLSDDASAGSINRITTISHAYQFHVDANGGRPSSKMICIWLQMLYRFSALRLSPDPIPIAREALTNLALDSQQKAMIAVWLWRLAKVLPANKAEELRVSVESFFLANSEASEGAHALCLLIGWSVDDRTSSLIDRWLAQYSQHEGAVELLNGWIPKAKELAEITSQAIGWLESHPRHRRAYLVIAPLLGRTANSDLTLRAAKRWIVANYDNQNVYHVIASMVASYGNDESVILIAKSWLRGNLGHPYSHQVLPALISQRSSTTDLREIALGWLSENPQHRSAQNIYAPLISRWPTDPQVIASAKDWLSRNEGHQAYAAILGSVVAHCENDPVTIRLGEEYLKRAKNGQRSTFIVALLYGGHASPIHVKLALDHIGATTRASASGGLLHRIGVALAHHPKSLIMCIAGDFSDEQGHLLCYRSVCALVQYHSLVENFLKIACSSIRGPFLVTILKTAIKHEIMPTILGLHVADWLVDNFRRPGYSIILGELTAHPTVYRRALATLKLSRTIQKDYSDLQTRAAKT